MADCETVNLFWTGGWDSTFRLLQLLHSTDAYIQPIYLVDEKRASVPREIETMRTIRCEIHDRVPGASDRLLPTEYGDFGTTSIEPHHQRQWEALQEKARVGYQYPNLASWAERNDIDRIELSIGQHVGEGSSLASLISPLVEIQATLAGPASVLSKGVDGPAVMLSRFSFPLLSRTKLDMKEEAERKGWMPIMQKTWSCFNPVLGLPCGMCNPCEIAKKKGMGHRVGFAGPVLARLRHVLTQVRVQIGEWRARAGGPRELT